MMLKSISAALALSLAALTYSAPAEANANDAIIAGAAGFAIGTLFGHVAAHPRYHRRVYVAPAYVPAYYVGRPGYYDWIAFCSAKYRSFNPATGLFVGYDGRYHPCHL